MKALWAPILLVVVALVGCSGEPMSSGYVRDKQFDPAHWEGGWDFVTRTEEVCKYRDDGFGFDGYGCEDEPTTDMVWDEQDTWVENRWKLLLESCSKGCISGWIWVDQTTYQQYGIGQHYPDPR